MNDDLNYQSLNTKRVMMVLPIAHLFSSSFLCVLSIQGLMLSPSSYLFPSAPLNLSIPPNLVNYECDCSDTHAHSCEGKSICSVVGVCLFGGGCLVFQGSFYRTDY